MPRSLWQRGKSKKLKAQGTLKSGWLNVKKEEKNSMRKLNKLKKKKSHSKLNTLKLRNFSTKKMLKLMA